MYVQVMKGFQALERVVAEGTGCSDEFVYPSEDNYGVTPCKTLKDVYIYVVYASFFHWSVATYSPDVVEGTVLSPALDKVMLA